MQAKQHPAGSPAAGGPLDAATLNKARADLGVAEAVRDQAKMALDSTRIKAPFDGVISRNRINPGDPVAASKTVLATLDANDPIGVVFKVAEPTLLNLTRLEMDEGLKINDLPILVKMTGDDDFRREARIKSVSQAIDRATGTGTIRATMPNPDRFLLPGMSAQVKMGKGQPYRVLVVPGSAVLTEEGRTSLQILDDHDRVEVRPVTLGQDEEGLQVVKDG